MSQYISEHFVPIKVHVKENPGGFKRFGAQWTPTQLILDANAEERHRMEGFFAADDFLAQLQLGLAKLDFRSHKYAEAAKQFRQVYEQHPDSGAAPEAVYWAGVSEYKLDNDGETLKRTGNALQEKYPQSEWSRKATVWIH